MAGDTLITLVGNLVDDPELRFTPSGAGVTKFRIASTPRSFDKQTNEWKDGESLFLTCNVWRQPAENVAETLMKGMRVIVQGRLQQRSYETKEGEKRTVYEIEVEEVGPSLRNATATVTRNPRPAGQGQQQGGGQQQSNGGNWSGNQRSNNVPQQRPAQQQSGGGWGNQSSQGFSDEPPF